MQILGCYRMLFPKLDVIIVFLRVVLPTVILLVHRKLLVDRDKIDRVNLLVINLQKL